MLGLGISLLSLGLGAITSTISRILSAGVSVKSTVTSGISLKSTITPGIGVKSV